MSVFERVIDSGGGVVVQIKPEIRARVCIGVISLARLAGRDRREHCGVNVLTVAGVLYAGVTSHLPKRAYEHREGVIDGFTKEHGLKRLVYYERHDTIQSAIQREKNIKHWPRAWKVRLIHSMNPNWDDLYDTLI